MSSINTSALSFASLLDQHIGTVFARQLLWADYLQIKQEPNINLEQGCVTFDNGLSFEIQLLGTQLELDNTWLWGWADELNGAIFISTNEDGSDFHAPFPTALLQDARELKALGLTHNINELAHPKLVLELSSSPLVPDEFNGDHIACVAAGIFNTAYWRDTRDEGVVYYLIKNLPPELSQPCKVPHILGSIEQITSYFETDNKVMTEAFLTQQGFTINWQAPDHKITSSDNTEVDDGSDEEDEDEHWNAKTTVLLARRGTEEITATFDSDDMLTEIEAHGFEGEENYTYDEDGYTEDEGSDNELSSVGGMDNVLSPWHSFKDDPDAEFPPKLPTA